MPVNSSSIPALVTAAKVRRRRRKRRASGGGIFDWSGVGEAMPEHIGRERPMDPLYTVPKSIIYDLPKKAINESVRNPLPGLRREDYTDVPPDTSPDPRSPLGGVGIEVPRQGWQPVDPMVGASLEGGMNVMGGTALSAPAKGAGEFIAGAGPRDPRLWHPISKVKLPRPIDEMSAVHQPVPGGAPERVINPAELQGSRLIPLIGDRTGAGTRLTQVNGYRFDRPVEMQGGHGFMAQNVDRGAAWASEAPIASRLNKLAGRVADEGPVHGVYTAMGERSSDFSHHVSDTLSEMIQHSKITKSGRRAFDDEMRALDPNWPGVKSEKLRDHLASLPGGVRNEFAKMMDTARFQKEGFPSVAEARFATTDPRLLNADSLASGQSIARLDPARGTFSADHRTYGANVPGQYIGGLPESIPVEMMYPNMTRELTQYADKTAAAGKMRPTTAYLMTRTPKGLAQTEKVDQKWVDTVSKHLEGRGFRLGAGANDKRAAAAAVGDDAAAGWRGTGYHGTASDFDEFVPNAPFNKLTGKSDIEGIYFTGDPMQASGYARMAARREGAGKQRVIAADLAMQNPLDITKLIKNGQRRGLSFGDAKRAALEKVTPEHDGVVFRGNSVNPPEYIVFNNSQIARKPLTLGAGAADKRTAGVAALDDVDSILEAERRLTGASNEPAANIGAAERAAAEAPADPAVGPGGGGQAGARSLDEAQAAAARWAGNRPTLEGQQGPLKIAGDYFVPGPIGKIHDVAEDYMRTVHPDRPYTPPTKYHPIDPEHSKAIAQAYEEMKHTPNDPATKASYDALIDETAKQYQAIKATGLKIEPIPPGAPDPYATNPRLAARDVAENNHLWFFPTEGGFGTLNKISDNPMLRNTGEKIGDHELLANDMFRIVHDYFGHLKEGHGFRAAGEDNAWRTHAQMYSDLARPAMTTETRGQNSWVNYGPHGDKNRTASGADTVYADQKVGLMPEWVMRDRGSPEPIIAYHGTPYHFDRFSTKHLGAGEGNQAYGHGLYFAGHEPVSEWYRYQLAARRDGPVLQKYGLDSQDGANIGIDLHAVSGDASALAANYRKYVDDLRAEGRTDAATKNMIKRAEGKIAYLEDPERSQGAMYQVAIEADPKKFLDWDNPLPADDFEQFAAQFDKVNPTTRKWLEDWGYERQQRGLPMPDGEDIVREMKGIGDDAKGFSRALLEAGIPGIKYLDQGSRLPVPGARQTQNYVAFDDNMVKILRKYGIVGIPAAGVLGVDGEERRAAGGAVNAAMEVARRIKRAKGGKVHIGPIVGDTGGRADKVPMHVPDGAYVIPADIVSGLGEGNTASGMLQLADMFPKSKPSLMRGMKEQAVPILAADGEFVISPDSILDRWDDLDYGHKALDAWVLHERQQLIETLEGLAPPAQD